MSAAASRTLHPASCTLYHAPGIVYPVPIPCTIHPARQVRAALPHPRHPEPRVGHHDVCLRVHRPRPAGASSPNLPRRPCASMPFSGRRHVRAPTRSLAIPRAFHALPWPSAPLPCCSLTIDLATWQCILSGADAYLLKPLRVHELTNIWQVRDAHLPSFHALPCPSMPLPCASMPLHARPCPSG